MLLYGIDWQTARRAAALSPAGDGVRCGSGRSRSFFRFSMEQFRSSMHLIAMSHTHPAVEPPLTAEQLPDDLATLKNMILELLVSMHQPRPRPSGDAASTGTAAASAVRAARRTLQPQSTPALPRPSGGCARGESPADLRGEAQAEVPAAWSPPSAGESATCA